jgi:hypothetical protein
LLFSRSLPAMMVPKWSRFGAGMPDSLVRQECARGAGRTTSPLLAR